MMSYIELHLFSANSLADLAYAEKLYEIFDSFDYPPSVFDKFEPIKKPWSKKHDFFKAWKQQSQQFFGQVLIQRKKQVAYHADIMFQFGQNRKLDNKPPYHGISVYQIKESDCTGESRDQLFSELNMDYGFICSSGEYDAKNIVKNVGQPDGSIEPQKVIGMNWPYSIPSLYWTNNFGKKYLNQGFADDYIQLHPNSVTKVGDGIRLQTAKEPRFFESVESASVESSIRISLGQKWFFDSKTQGNCETIDVSLDGLRMPILT
jgi:hypothetical protein